MDLYSIYNKKAFLMLEMVEADPLFRDFVFGKNINELPKKDIQVKDKLNEVSPSEIQTGIKTVKLPANQLGGLKVKQDKEEAGIAGQTARLIHNSTIKGIVDENERLWDIPKLIKLTTKRPNNILAQNSKMKVSGFGKDLYLDLSLPAYHGLWYDESKKEFNLVRTCPSAGDCKYICYASKGGYVQYEPVAIKMSKTLNYLLNDPEGFEKQMVNEIETVSNRIKKNGKNLIVRWHDSGDFFNEAYLRLAISVIERTPLVQHYAYTKQISEMKSMKLPDNFTVNYSHLGTQDEKISADDKQAKIIPKELFNDLDLSKKEDQDTLKQRASDHLKLPVNTILTYPELEHIPKGNEPKYNVLVWKGHGDDSGSRRDVRFVLLLMH
jgi:hypothetical protein